MIKARMGEQFDGWLKNLCPYIFRLSLNPNCVSLLGGLLAVVSALFLANGIFVWGGLMILTSGCFDLIDGALARHQGRASAFGGLLDSTVDRFVDMILLLGILICYASEGKSNLAYLTGIALIASVLVSYVKARAENVLSQLESGLFERGERILVLAVGAITGLMPIALVLIALGSIFTVVQRIAEAHRKMRALEGDAPSGAMEVS